MRRDGRSIREMGRVLGRSHSTISRELRRNSSPVHHSYIDHRAQVRADKRRSKASRRMRLKNDNIRDYVESKLKQNWSPEQIAGRIGIDHPGSFISHEAIYQYIYHPSTPNRQELIGCLRRFHKRRKRKGSAPDKHKSKIVNRVGIEHRPREVKARNRFGDWEADTLTSRQSKAAVLSMVERKSRLVQLERLDARTASLTSQAMINCLIRFPKDARRTLTLDNGTENAGHEEISKETDIRCFFCEPYSSWQRGTNEHTNGLVRGYLPKKTNFATEGRRLRSTISNEDIKLIEFRLNNRPRTEGRRMRSNCLGFKTPLEVANLCVALQR